MPVDVKQGDTAVEDLLFHIGAGNYNSPWNWDGDGIRGWLRAQDVKVMNDSGSIVPAKEDDAQYVEEFRRFLGVATKHELGLLSVVNLDSRRYEKSAPPLPNEELWKGMEMQYLVRS